MNIDKFKENLQFYFGTEFQQGILKGANHQYCFLEECIVNTKARQEVNKITQVTFESLAAQLKRIEEMDAEDKKRFAADLSFSPVETQIRTKPYVFLGAGIPNVWKWLLKNKYDLFSILED